MTALETAIHTHEAAERDLAAAKAKLFAAEAAFDEDAAPARKRAVADAEIDLRRSERILTKAHNELEQARKAAAELERAACAKELADLENELSTWNSAIETAASQLVELDCRAVDVIRDVAKATKLAADTHARAELLAQQLGQSVRFTRMHMRATLPEARLRIQRMITAARLDANRSAYAPLWLANANLDEAGFNAADLEQVRDWAAKMRQLETDAATFQRGVIAGANAAPAPTTTDAKEATQ